MDESNGADQMPTTRNIGGHYGSPTFTIALPFSKVTRVDGELRDEMVQLAAIVERLAAAVAPRIEPGMAGELAAVRDAAHDLARRLAESE